MNQEDQRVIREIQEMFDVKSTSTIIKMAVHNYYTVLQSNFSPRYIKYLFKKERHRLSDYEHTDEANFPKM